MRHLRLLITMVMMLLSLAVYADTTYKVAVSSRLNVRRSPSTNAAVVGTFKSEQLIQVISIERGWAKVRFGNGVGYVSSKYIKLYEMPVPAASSVKTPPAAKEVKKEEPIIQEEAPAPKKHFSFMAGDAEPPLTFGHFLNRSMSLYLGVEAGLGYSTFFWDSSRQGGRFAWRIDLQGQLYFNDKALFIPRDWYMELAFGYSAIGANGYPMNYFHIRAYPLGYTLKLDPMRFVVTAGVDMGVPLSELRTSLDSWSADFNVAVGCALRAEWTQFAVGLHTEYGFTNVASGARVTLNNFAVMGTLSYKFAQIGNKK